MADEGRVVYSAAYEDIYQYKTGKIINVEINGSELSVYGLFLDADCIKGTIDGDKLTIAKDQYLGKYTDPMGDTYTLYAIPCDLRYNEQGDFYYTVATNQDMVLSYDAESKAFAYNGYIATSPYKSADYRDNYVSVVRFPEFKPFTEVAATPLDPGFFSYSDFDPMKGYGYVNGNVPARDVDGNFILPEKTYFKVYFDDNLFTFTPKQYSFLKDDMTEVPLGYYDNYDFFQGGYFFFYETDYKRIGLQSIYKGNGETRVSNIVYTDGSVIPAGVTTIASDDKEVASVAYTDLQGRSISKPASGLYIQTEVYTDGSRKSIIKKIK